MNSTSLRGLRNVLCLSASVLLLAQSPPEASRVLYVPDPAGGQVRKVSVFGFVNTAEGSRMVELTVGAGGEPAAIAITPAVTAARSPASDAAIPPFLSIYKVALSDFVQGQPNASYYLQVSNAIGSATTSGTVMVTEVPSASLTLQSMRGPGWQCSGDTCTRSDALPGDYPTFPPILVSVNISASAPSTVANRAIVSGGGSQDNETLITSPVSPGPPNVLPAPQLVSPANGAVDVPATPQMAWTAVSGASGYLFQFATDPLIFPDDPYSSGLAPSPAEAIVGGIGTTSFTATGLMYATTYYWRVRATNVNAGGNWSEIRSFTTATATPLPAPTLIFPFDSSTVYASPVNFSWTPVSGATGYRLMVLPGTVPLPSDPAAEICGVCAVNVTTSTPAYSLPALEPGSSYRWVVRAFNAVQGGNWSAPRAISTTAQLTSPQLVSPSDGATGVSIPASFSWHTVPEATGYRIMIAANSSTLPADPYTTACPGCLFNATTSATSFTALALQPQTTYFWRVRATSPVMGGAWPATRSFTTGSVSLVAPNQLSPPSGATNLPAPVVLRWTAVSGATGYRVAVALKSSALPTTPDDTICNACAISATSPETSLDVSGLEGGTTYYWKVAAYNIAQRGDWSGVFSFTTQAFSSVLAGGLVNAASYTAPVAPGSLAAVFGNFAVSSLAPAPSLPLPSTLGGLALQFSGGLRAPLIYASDERLYVQVPWELAGQSQSSATVWLNGQTGPAQVVNLAPFSPAIFTTNALGTGQGVVLDEQNRLLDASHPATAGRTVAQIFCTGLGAVTHQPATGAPAPLDPLAETTTKPVVIIGGAPAEVRFSGLVPGLAGMYQVNAVVPATAATGAEVPLTIFIGGVSSNVVTLAVLPPAT